MCNDDATEYDCARCGIRVIHCIPQPSESMYCSQCRFIKAIDDPKAKAEAAEFLNKHNPMFAQDK